MSSSKPLRSQGHNGAVCLGRRDGLPPLTRARRSRKGAEGLGRSWPAGVPNARQESPSASLSADLGLPRREAGGDLPGEDRAVVGAVELGPSRSFLVLQRAQKGVAV